MIVQNDDVDDHTKLLLVMTSKTFYLQFNKFIKDSISKRGLRIKYSQCDDLYEEYVVYGLPQNHVHICNWATGVLLDAIFSSYVHIDEVEQIIELFPNSVIFSLGIMRCRRFVSPLAAAIYDTRIGIDIIELLLMKGANPNTFISLDGQLKHIYNDIPPHVRKTQIQKLLVDYGAKPDLTPPNSDYGIVDSNFEFKKMFDLKKK